MAEIIVIGLLVAAYMALVVFVYRDATRRRREVLPWLLLVVFAPFVGAVAYLASVVFARPEPAPLSNE